MNLGDAVRAKRVAVWGAGVEGRAAAELLAVGNDVVVIADRVEAPDVAALARDLGAVALTPDEAIAGRPLDLVVRSPGVSVHRPEVTALAASGARVTTLMNLWLEFARPPLVVGVTGTKGKSSTSLMIRALLEGAGRSVEVVGNIGRPIVEATGCDVAIVEISSYQAADLSQSPDIGVLTNIGVDHLPWHGTQAQYRADKLRMFAHLQLRRAALGVRDPALEAQLAARRIATSVVGAATYSNVDGVLHRGGTPLGNLAGSPFAVRHFGDNLALACIVAEAVTGSAVTPDDIARLLSTFELPPGRMELVDEVGGIRWINDCLASNPMAAAAGIDAHRGAPLVLILGGSSRGVGIEPLVEAVRRHGAVRGVIVVGDVARPWAVQLGHAAGMVVTIEDDDVVEAVGRAAAIARPGDTVLFSPGAPTSAHVGNWQDRRRQFIATVEKLPH